MANTTTIYQVFTALVTAIQEKTDETNIYLMNRPDIADDNAKSFVVVDLPLQIYRNLVGTGDSLATTQGRITLFVKSRTDGTPNINAITQKMDALVKLFPLDTDIAAFTNARETMGGKDDYGYQYMIIRFKIRIK